MEENKETQKENNFVKYSLLTLFLAGGTYFKRKKFLNFIERVKFSIRVKGIRNNVAFLNIMPLNFLNVPYHIKSIDLIHEKQNLAATNSSCDLHQRIVSNSNIDVHFNLMSPNIDKQVLQECELAITYSFFKFSFTRLYKPLNFVDTNSTTIVDVPVSSCGCKK
ncbi:hypothetical protein [uncultured Tenacibaculum sp.]|uniref:hypothetical protein n=1 Tax=uncultured Tenacibaculum sp. TaxID=174713 RepID=UPI00262F225E|nr:hypothetical protein [uncultured Tenacibaculum sp.]